MSTTDDTNAARRGSGSNDLLGLAPKRKELSMQLMEWVSADPDRRTKLTHPYSYDPFTMWRGPGEPDGGVYTDRLFQWDHKKHDALCMKHFGDRGQYWDRRDADKIQAFLRDYLDAPELVLCEVQEHCNQATGYPCWYFAYCKTPNAMGTKKAPNLSKPSVHAGFASSPGHQQ